MFNLLVAVLYSSTAVVANKFLLERNKAMRQVDHEQQALLVTASGRNLQQKMKNFVSQKENSIDNESFNEKLMSGPESGAGSDGDSQRSLHRASFVSSASSRPGEEYREVTLVYSRVFSDNVSQYYLLILAYSLISSIMLQFSCLMLTLPPILFPLFSYTADQVGINGANLSVGNDLATLVPVVLFYYIVAILFLTIAGLSDGAAGRSHRYKRIRAAIVMIPLTLALIIGVVLSAIPSMAARSPYVDVALAFCFAVALPIAGFTTVSTIKSFAKPEQIRKVRIVCLLAPTSLAIKGVIVMPALQTTIGHPFYMIGVVLLSTWIPVATCTLVLRR